MLRDLVPWKKTSPDENSESPSSKQPQTSGKKRKRARVTNEEDIATILLGGQLQYTVRDSYFYGFTAKRKDEVIFRKF